MAADYETTIGSCCTQGDAYLPWVIAASWIASSFVLAMTGQGRVVVIPPISQANIEGELGSWSNHRC